MSFVERMVTRESFAIRHGERREWLRSGQTRTDITLLMVCLSLVCHYGKGVMHMVPAWRVRRASGGGEFAVEGSDGD
jgi:hypothetical protein